MSRAEANILSVEGEDVPQLPRRPKTVAVLGMLSGVALIFSYLIAYCFVNALVSAEVMAPITPDHDLRPRLLIGSFAVLMVVFVGLAGVFRWTSRRQLKRIDEMETETDVA
jgi:hypothetical protein